MSLEPSREVALRSKAILNPGPPGASADEAISVDELKATNDRGVFAMLRRFFVK